MDSNDDTCEEKFNECLSIYSQRLFTKLHISVYDNEGNDNSIDYNNRCRSSNQLAEYGRKAPNKNNEVQQKIIFIASEQKCNFVCRKSIEFYNIKFYEHFQYIFRL